MIGLPFDRNDLWCLGTMTEAAADLLAVRPAWLTTLVSQFPTTQAYAEWIRSLPQRDDEGDPYDGPKVHACRPHQRLRFFPADPNCYERTFMYLVGAELIDPRPRRQAATIDLRGGHGRHTIPIEDGQPIVLNPGESVGDLVRALDLETLAWKVAAPPMEGSATAAVAIGSAPVASPAAASPEPTTEPRLIQLEPDAELTELEVNELTELDVNKPTVVEPPRAPAVVDIHDAVDYTTRLGDSAVRNLRNGPGRAWRARAAIRNLVDEGIAPRDRQTIDAMGWFFAHAERVARAYGSRALTIVRTTAQAVADLVDDVLAREQRNLSFDIGGAHIGIPSWLTDAAGTVGRIGLDVGAVAFAPQLAELGITGKMVDLVEQELNRDGLTLGPLAHAAKSLDGAADALGHASQAPSRNFRNARAKFFSASQSCRPRVGGGGYLVRSSYRVPPFLADDVLLVEDRDSGTPGRVHCVAWDSTWQERIPARSGWLDRNTLTPVLEPGMRVELSPACPLWVAGAKHGTVRNVTKDWTVIVKMDDPRVTRLQRFTDHTQLTPRPDEQPIDPVTQAPPQHAALT